MCADGADIGASRRSREDSEFQPTENLYENSHYLDSCSRGCCNYRLLVRPRLRAFAIPPQHEFPGMAPSYLPRHLAIVLCPLGRPINSKYRRILMARSPAGPLSVLAPTPARGSHERQQQC